MVRKELEGVGDSSSCKYLIFGRLQLQGCPRLRLFLQRAIDSRDNIFLKEKSTETTLLLLSSNTPQGHANYLGQYVMNLLQYARSLYSLDNLDTRLTTSSKTPPSRIDPARSLPDEGPYKEGRRSGTDELAKGPSPPRWSSPEFIYHALVFLVAIPLMFKTAFDVSKREDSFAFLQ